MQFTICNTIQLCIQVYIYVHAYMRARIYHYYSTITIIVSLFIDMYNA